MIDLILNGRVAVLDYGWHVVIKAFVENIKVVCWVPEPVTWVLANYRQLVDLARLLSILHSSLIVQYLDQRVLP